MMKGFRDWLMVEFDRGRGKIGLYTAIDDVLGQYPPLYSTARIADLITYIDIAYGGKGPKSKNGIVDYRNDGRSSECKSVWKLPGN
jgi:hypothetical protein